MLKQNLIVMSGSCDMACTWGIGEFLYLSREEEVVVHRLSQLGWSHMWSSLMVQFIC